MPSRETTRLFINGLFKAVSSQAAASVFCLCAIPPYLLSSFPFLLPALLRMLLFGEDDDDPAPTAGVTVTVMTLNIRSSGHIMDAAGAPNESFRRLLGSCTGPFILFLQEVRLQFPSLIWDLFASNLAKLGVRAGGLSPGEGTAALFSMTLLHQTRCSNFRR